jgi:hypothetical protein
VQDIVLTFNIDGKTYFAKASESSAELTSNNDGTITIATLASYQTLFDASGQVFDDLFLKNQAASLKLVVDDQMNLLSANLDIVTI